MWDVRESVFQLQLNLFPVTKQLTIPFTHQAAPPSMRLLLPAAEGCDSTRTSRRREEQIVATGGASLDASAHPAPARTAQAAGGRSLHYLRRPYSMAAQRVRHDDPASLMPAGLRDWSSGDPIYLSLGAGSKTSTWTWCCNLVKIAPQPAAPLPDGRSFEEQVLLRQPTSAEEIAA